MKNLLLTLSSVSTLTLSSGISSFLSIDNNVSSINNNFSDTNQSIFSNSYKALGSSTTWITNQSTMDKQYYSYDLSYLPAKLSNGVDPKTLFTVDNNGKLQYKSGAQAQIPDQDKSTVANVKTQIETNKKVSAIKDSYNLYSSSVYNNQYFSGPNSDWQYLQFGGVEKHIDISSQTNADRVENYQSLSESLGLYYIAKANREKKIDQSEADSLAQYFISKSSLASTLGNNSSLVKKIMNLLDYNDEVYNWVFNTQFYNNDKNYSLNFIFDTNNNLVEIYYNHWDKEIQKNLNYQNKVEYNDYKSHGFSSGLKGIPFNWKQYAKNWADFTKVFPTITFDPSNFVKATGDGWNFVDEDANDLTINTSNIKLNTFYPVVSQDILSPAWGPTEYIGHVSVLFFITDTALVWVVTGQYNGDKCSSLWDITFDINLTTITFNSIME